MTLLHRIFPGLFPQPKGASELCRALEALEPSTESLKRKLDREEAHQAADVSRNALGNTFSRRHVPESQGSGR